MSKAEWDKTGEREYQTGVSNGVLYVIDPADGSYKSGVAWSGLISIEESPTGAEPTALYADNIKYLELTSKEEFVAALEAYMYPDEFKACMGQKDIATGAQVTQQTRAGFGLAYITKIGSDTEGLDKGEKLHLVYGAKAAPASKSYETEGETPNALTMAWDITTTPVDVPGEKPTAHIIIDSTEVAALDWTAIIELVFGLGAVPGTTDPELPSPAEIIALLPQG